MKILKKIWDNVPEITALIAIIAIIFCIFYDIDPIISVKIAVLFIIGVLAIVCKRLMQASQLLIAISTVLTHLVKKESDENNRSIMAVGKKTR